MAWPCSTARAIAGRVQSVPAVSSPKCGSTTRRIGAANRLRAPLEAMVSTYRSPLADVGVVARAGTLLGDQPITVDVLRQTNRAVGLAATFRAAVESTAYYQRWMLTSDPLPLDVLKEYAAVACLCRLSQLADERDPIHNALFDTDPTPSVIDSADNLAAEPAGEQATTVTLDGVAEELGAAAVVQRRRSVAHYLTILDAQPSVVEDEAIYREGLWTPPTPRSESHALVAGQWAALIAKDVWQDAICSVWSEFCRAGIAQLRHLNRGLTWTEVRDLAANLTDGPPALTADQATASLAGQLAAGGLPIAAAGDTVIPATATLEQLRQLTSALDTATSGPVVLLELDRRTRQLDNRGWRQSSGIASAWQPSLATVLDGLHAHLTGRPTVGDTLWWLVEQFIVGVHERIAYSKLSNAEFTFRFRWEDGLLRFFDHGDDRFPLAAIRHEPLASLTADLGLWTRDDQSVAKLTARGRAFVDEALA